jgi:hypothetical protein
MQQRQKLVSGQPMTMHQLFAVAVCTGISDLLTSRNQYAEVQEKSRLHIRTGKISIMQTPANWPKTIRL